MNKPNMTNNRTGISVAPEMAQEMKGGTTEFRPSSSGDGRGIVEMRVQYARQGATVGTFPPPMDQQQFQQAASRAPNQMMAQMFMNKLGARLAFERTGVRLYEALLSKHESHGGFEGGPSPQDITQICEEELRHFQMLREVIDQLGGDPTAVTPAADVQGTAGMGLTSVLADPRTDLIDALDAILLAELADNASWESLVSMAEQVGESSMVEMFRQAVQTEEQHLSKVKGWLSAAQQVLATQRMAA